jgi:hypothetical protein
MFVYVSGSASGFVVVPSSSLVHHSTYVFSYTNIASPSFSSLSSSYLHESAVQIKIQMLMMKIYLYQYVYDHTGRNEWNIHPTQRTQEQQHKTHECTTEEEKLKTGM